MYLKYLRSLFCRCADFLKKGVLALFFVYRAKGVMRDPFLEAVCVKIDSLFSKKKRFIWGFFSQSTQSIPAVVVLPQDQVLYKILTVPKEKNFFYESCLYALEGAVPLSIEEIEPLFSVLEEREEDLLVAAFAVKKDFLALQKEQIEVENLSGFVTEAQALAAFFYSLDPESPPVWLLHFGEKRVVIVLSYQGKVYACHSMDVSLFDKKEARLAFLWAAKKMAPFSVEADLFLWRQDLPKEYVEEITHILEVNKKTFAKDFSFSNPDMPVVRGAALLGTNLNSKFFPAKESHGVSPWWFHRKALSFVAALLMVFTTSSLFFFSEWKKTRIHAMQENIVEMVGDLELDKNLLLEGSSVSLKSVLWQAHERLSLYPALFPLHPQVPRVRDLLDWFAEHPVVKQAENEGAPFRLETLHYQMLKRPQWHKKQEPYTVRVELEFSTPSSRYARQFHEALLFDRFLVSTKEEMKWVASKGKYKVIFFLKDKTSYL